MYSNSETMNMFIHIQLILMSFFYLQRWRFVWTICQGFLFLFRFLSNNLDGIITLYSSHRFSFSSKDLLNVPTAMNDTPDNYTQPFTHGFIILIVQRTFSRHRKIIFKKNEDVEVLEQLETDTFSLVGRRTSPGYQQ